MKKRTINKALKTAIATLSVLLVLISAMCVTVMAEDTSVTPEIVSKNVSFDDNLHMYFAVPAEGIDVSNITLKVYEDAAGQNELQTPRTPAVNKDDGTYIITKCKDKNILRYNFNYLLSFSIFFKVISFKQKFN